MAATAACLLVKKSDFDQIGGFDDTFHNGFEDIDLCLRLGDCGQRIRYCPTSVVYHLESVTRWYDRPESTEHNDTLYDQRWRGRVTADDIQHFMDDGLLAIEYGQSYPVTLTISPLLAAARYDDTTLSGVEELLTARSRQVMDLLFAQTRAVLRERSVAMPTPPVAHHTTSPKSTTLFAGGSHLIGEGPARHLVSVLMPVKNEATSLAELIPLVLNQTAPAMLEIIAVDSGSDDDTVEVLRQFNATIISIDPADFNHGLTRNLAAERAKGDLLLFLNGRTRPIGPNWLGPLLADIDEDPTVAGTCSRVVAHPDADLLVRAEGLLELSGDKARQRKSINDWDVYPGDVARRA